MVPVRPLLTESDSGHQTVTETQAIDEVGRVSALVEILVLRFRRADVSRATLMVDLRCSEIAEIAQSRSRFVCRSVPDRSYDVDDLERKPRR